MPFLVLSGFSHPEIELWLKSNGALLEESRVKLLHTFGYSHACIIVITHFFTEI